MPAQRYEGLAPELGTELLRCLYQERMFRTWMRDQPQGWEIVSGRWSPYYFMLRDAPSRPHVFQLVVKTTSALLRATAPNANRLVGLAATGIPIAAAAAYDMGIPMGFNRKLANVRSLQELEREVHKYGGHRLVEGDFAPGDRVVIFDDVVSHFDSKEIAIQQLRMELANRHINDVEVEAVVVLVDRGTEAVQRARAADTRLERLVVLGEDCELMLKGIATDREIEVIQDYVYNPDKYQDKRLQDELRREALASQLLRVSIYVSSFQGKCARGRGSSTRSRAVSASKRISP
jgi:orotate phosphoribosyltransferase